MKRDSGTFVLSEKTLPIYPARIINPSESIVSNPIF